MKPVLKGHIFLSCDRKFEPLLSGHLSYKATLSVLKEAWLYHETRLNRTSLGPNIVFVL